MMKAQRVNFHELPNTPDTVIIYNVHPDNFAYLEAAGGQRINEGFWGTFAFPKSAVGAGQVWAGFNAPQFAANEYQIGDLVIRTWGQKYGPAPEAVAVEAASVVKLLAMKGK